MSWCQGPAHVSMVDYVTVGCKANSSRQFNDTIAFHRSHRSLGSVPKKIEASCLVSSPCDALLQSPTNTSMYTSTTAHQQLDSYGSFWTMHFDLFDWRNQYQYVYCIWWVNKCSGLWYISIASHRWTELNFVVDSWCLMCYVVMLNVLLCRILFSRLFQFLALKFNKWRHQGIIRHLACWIDCVGSTGFRHTRNGGEDWRLSRKPAHNISSISQLHSMSTLRIISPPVPIGNSVIGKLNYLVEDKLECSTCLEPCTDHMLNVVPEWMPSSLLRELHHDESSLRKCSKECPTCTVELALPADAMCVRIKCLAKW